MRSIALAALVLVGSFSHTAMAGSLISDTFEILLAPEVVLPTDKPDDPDDKKPPPEPRRVLNVCEASGGRKIIVNHGRNWQCVYKR